MESGASEGTRPIVQHSHSYSSTTYAQAAAAAGISSSSPFTPISYRATHIRLTCIVAMSLARTSAVILLYHSPSPLRTHPGSAQFPHQSVAANASHKDDPGVPRTHNFS